MCLPLFRIEFRYGCCAMQVLTVSDAAIAMSGMSTLERTSTTRLANIHRRGHRSDYILVESLIRKFFHAIETRRGDGDIPLIGLVLGQSQDREVRTKDGRTHLQRLFHKIKRAIDGHSKQFLTSFRELLETRPREPAWDMPHLRLDCQSGITGVRKLWNGRIGNVSTRKAPGVTACSKCSVASSAACKNLSLWDLMSIP